MTSPAASFVPFAPVRRHALADALRGLALFGTLMVALQRIPLPDARSALLLVLLLGAGRLGVLRESVAHRRFWRGLLAASLVTHLLLPLLRGGAPATAGLWLQQVASLAQGLSCIAAFVLLFQHPAWRRRLCRLAPLGRMPLTHGLVQAVLGLCLLGCGIELTLWEAMLCGAAVFGVQAVASCWWAARCRSGPLERAWRGLFAGRRHGPQTYTFRRSATTP